MQALVPGTVIAVDLGPIRHVGIITDRTIHGWPMVISASKRTGCVTEESVHEFANGRKVHILDIVGNLPWKEVLRRARSQIGRRWDLFLGNCEHFVRWSHGLKPTSPQLWAGIALVVFVLGMGSVMAKGK